MTGFALIAEILRSIDRNGLIANCGVDGCTPWEHYSMFRGVAAALLAGAVRDLDAGHPLTDGDRRVAALVLTWTRATVPPRIPVLLAEGVPA